MFIRRLFTFFTCTLSHISSQAPGVVIVKSQIASSKQLVECFAVISTFDPQLKNWSQKSEKNKNSGKSTKTIYNAERLTRPDKDPCRGTEMGDGISRDITSTRATSDLARTPRAWAADSRTAGVRDADLAMASTVAAPPLWTENIEDQRPKNLKKCTTSYTRKNTQIFEKQFLKALKVSIWGKTNLLECPCCSQDTTGRLDALNCLVKIDLWPFCSRWPVITDRPSGLFCPDHYLVLIERILLEKLTVTTVDRIAWKIENVVPIGSSKWKNIFWSENQKISNKNAEKARSRRISRMETSFTKNELIFQMVVRNRKEWAEVLTSDIKRSQNQLSHDLDFSF